MVLRLCLAGSLAWLLASCGLPNGLPASDPLSRTAALPAVQVDAECDAPVFDIQGSRRWDAPRSQLIIKVYREGEWARFGHNHVLEVVNPAGAYHRYRHGHLAGMLSFMLADMRLDDPQARRRAGPDFATPLSERAIAETRTNMLSAAVLDAERFPAVHIAGIVRLPAGRYAAAPAVARLWITLHGRQRCYDLPVTLSRVNEQVGVSGKLVLSQRAFGITPYEAFCGLLRVKDELEVEFAWGMVAD